MLSTITGLIEAFAGLYILYLVLYRFWTVPWSGKELRETTGAPHLAGAVGAAAWGWAGNLANKIGAGEAWKKHVEQEVRTLPQRKLEILKILAFIKSNVETATRFDSTIRTRDWSFKKTAGVAADKFEEKILKDVINVGLTAADMSTIDIADIKNSFTLLENEAKELNAFTTKEAKEITKQITQIIKEKNIQQKLENYKNILNGFNTRIGEIYNTTKDNDDAGSTLKSEYQQQAGTRTGIIPDLIDFDKILTTAMIAIAKIS